MCASTWYPAFGTQTSPSPIAPVFQWKQLDFDYATEADRQAAIANGDFDPIALVPIDVDVYYEGNLFAKKKPVKDYKTNTQ